MVDVSAQAADRARGDGRRPRRHEQQKRSISCSKATPRKAMCLGAARIAGIMAAKTHP